MSDKIRHNTKSRDSLYREIELNLERVCEIWLGGEESLRFSLPILCAAKLEAFINAAGKLKTTHWDIFERKLSFEEKCHVVLGAAGVHFDRAAEPNKTAIATFETRNSLVHPKMKLKEIDETISGEEYERRVANADYSAERHHLRSELTPERVTLLKDTSDAFVTKWGPALFDGYPEYWLAAGSSGVFRRA